MLTGGTFQGKETVTQWVKNAMNHFPVYEFDIKHVSAKNQFDLIGNNIITVILNETHVETEGVAYHVDGLLKLTFR